jgi:pimeloyl-ACP methyl ester carboxylesterase
VLRDVTVGGLRVAYDQRGDGPPLVLLHGGLDDSRLWRWQLEGLSDEFTVAAWDAPGGGRSSDAPAHWRMAEWAECAAAWIEAADISPAHVLGLSWGSSVALELYRRRPGVVRSLILASAYAGWAGSLSPEACAERLESALRDAHLPPEAIAAAWLPSLLPPAGPPGLDDELVAVMVHNLARGALVPMVRSMAEADLRDVLPGIRVPTLLLYGELDQRSPLPVAEALHAVIPTSRLVVIPGVGHMSNMEAPDAFTAHVREFIRPLGG